MIRNLLIVALRNFTRGKVHSLINIAGLAVGMAVFIMISMWVADELSYDRFHEDYSNIYRVIGKGAYFEEGIDGAPAPLANAIKSEVPEVIKVARIMDVPKLVISSESGSFYETKIMLTEQPFFDIFSFPFALGDPHNALLSPNCIVITEQTAEKYFPRENPVGKTLTADNRYQLVVSGVLKNIPQNSSLKFDMIAPLQMLREEFAERESQWGAFMTTTYMKVNPESDVESIVSKLNRIGAENNCPQFNDGVLFDLQPLLDIHLDGKNNHHDYADIGNSAAVYGFSLVAIFVLLIACANFVNLSTAGAVSRAKEVAMRKTVGAGRTQLIAQFLAESIFLSTVSLVLAVVIAELFLPMFNNLVQKSLTINPLDPFFVSGALITIIMTGIVSGIYPAFYLSSFKPVAILKGEGGTGSGRSASRKILVAFQFSLSTALLIGTIVTYLQLDYIKSKDLGFDKDNIIHIPLKENIATQFPSVKAELLASPYIESVASQYNLEALVDFSTNGFVWEGGTPDFQLQFNTSRVGMDYFETLKFGLADGRFFSKELSSDTVTAVMINEEAAAKMGLEDPVGKRFGFRRPDAIIIGVVKNANLESLKKEIIPRVYFPLTGTADAAERGKVLIRFAGENYREALAHVRDVWSRFNKISPFEFELLNDTYDNLYRLERNTGSIINLFTVLAIFISCLGLIGLITSITRRRTREIGIRKILGGTVIDILYTITRDYMIPIILANLIAWPVSYIILKKLLQVYAYRIDMSIWIFFVAGLVMAIVGMATVGLQALKAANSNPVDTLRYE